MTIPGIFLLLLLTSSCRPSTSQSAGSATTEKLLNILDIAGQTQEDIATILGHQSQLDPESAAKSGCPTCQKYSYKDGLVKIVYINDMADWITITPSEAVQAQQVPTLLGLPDRSPDSSSNRMLHWNNYPTIHSIQVYITPDGTIEYIYLKVTTP